MTETSHRTPMRIRSIPDAIAAVPYLLGFHPADSMIVIGFGGPHHTCAVRVDLPPLDDPAAHARTAGHAAGVLGGGGLHRALVLGYGARHRVEPAFAAIRDTLPLEIVDAARVADGRWWSLVCDVPDCCPPGGTPYDIASSVVAAEATLAGRVALPGRSELASTVAPLQGPARDSMRRATLQAERRLRSQDPAALRDEALALLHRLRRAPSPAYEEIAWLGVLLTDLRIRDEAFVRIDLDDPSADIAFWRTVLRHVEEPYAAAPACLLARAAYAAGDGGLANIALDRADPDYSMAILLQAVIAAGIPPDDPRLRMTPEELSDIYAAQEDP
ncbi:DUF4192 domain-containing protein [Spirillospora sp. NPDC029432]|uniref:DUF4192 domain-containing protein n=1 Tax=Spirillospora sp. NPDC029432 TaxID=3154599 RepID=UPI0034569D39